MDDNATNRDILEQWLRSWQAEPLAVGDGMAAMDALQGRRRQRPTVPVGGARRRHARNGRPDGGCHDPSKSGAELAATRIILLTSWDRPDDPERFRELRIDAHLLKPVQQDELLETICRVMSRSLRGRMQPEGTD